MNEARDGEKRAAQAEQKEVDDLIDTDVGQGSRTEEPNQTGEGWRTKDATGERSNLTDPDQTSITTETPTDPNHITQTLDLNKTPIEIAIITHTNHQSTTQENQTTTLFYHELTTIYPNHTEALSSYKTLKRTKVEVILKFKETLPLHKTVI